MARVVTFSEFLRISVGKSARAENAAVIRLVVSLVARPAREEGGFVLLAAGPLGIEGQQFLEGIGLRNAVRIEYPDPIIAVLQSKTKAAMDSAARPRFSECRKTVVFLTDGRSRVPSVEALSTSRIPSTGRVCRKTPVVRSMMSASLKV